MVGILREQDTLTKRDKDKENLPKTEWYHVRWSGYIDSLRC